MELSTYIQEALDRIQESDLIEPEGEVAPDEEVLGVLPLEARKIDALRTQLVGKLRANLKDCPEGICHESSDVCGRCEEFKSILTLLSCRFIESVKYEFKNYFIEGIGLRRGWVAVSLPAEREHSMPDMDMLPEILGDAIGMMVIGSDGTQIVGSGSDGMDDFPTFPGEVHTGTMRRGKNGKGGKG